VSNVIILFDYVFDEVWVCFVYRVVRQVHTHIVHVTCVYRLVRLRRETGQPVSMDKNPERVSTRQQDINP
jgi:hypothetical protein